MVLVLKQSHLQTPILSIPVFHNSNSPCVNRHCVLPARHQNPPGYVSRKVSRHVKHMLSVASPPPVEVSENEAVGMVSAAQANFMRVVVEDGVELLCVVRGLLKYHHYKGVLWIQRWGYEPVFCSVETKCGLDTLLSRLSGKTSVIVGPSGVGKSSLINALRSKTRDTNGGHSTIVGSKWLEDQRVGEVSTRSGKGKHTTRNVCLLPLYGGFIADTPGFNKPTLLNVTNQSLAQLFPEVRKMLETANCAFNDCLHIGEPVLSSTA